MVAVGFPPLKGSENRQSGHEGHTNSSCSYMSVTAALMVLLSSHKKYAEIVSKYQIQVIKSKAKCDVITDNNNIQFQYPMSYNVIYW